MNLANLGKAGLLVAQNRLQTTAHNINNSDTEGYSRQSVLSQTAGATATAGGWIGRGVQAVSVQRAYDGFLGSQLAQARTKSAALNTYGAQISQINNLLADRTVGITPAIQAFFDGMQAVATAPADSAARQELIGRANSLATQIRNANGFLNEQRADINTQISTTVAQVNSYLDRIQDVNRQISVAKAVSPQQPPNDLFDQRDQLVSELGGLIDIKVFEQDDRVNLTVGNGQVVLGGDSVFHLQAQASASDPGRLAVHSTIPDGQGGVTAVELDDAMVQGGKLGGLLAFRRDALDSVQNELGRLATGIALSINDLHQTGYDLSGTQGGAFFSVGGPRAIPNAGNAGSGAPAMSVTDINKLSGQDYQIEFDGGQYRVTRLPAGTLLATAAGTAPFEVDGIRFDFSAVSASAGDRWTIQPTRDAAATLQVQISDPGKIAAAGETEVGSGVGAGSANGAVALQLAALQTSKVLGNGAMSLNEAYAQIVNRVGVLTQQNTTAQKAQDTLVQQNYAAQQALSGVNLNEEFMNLNQYQEQFRAASRLIDVSSTLFDTLLGLRT